MKKNLIDGFCRVAAAVILLQTLFFKFTAAPESVEIFSRLGAEPWGRLGSGLTELAAAGLLLAPRLVRWGALLTAGLMAGALLAHAFVLGFEIRGDGGLLFGLALATEACALILLTLRGWPWRRDRVA